MPSLPFLYLPPSISVFCSLCAPITSHYCIPRTSNLCILHYLPCLFLVTCYFISMSDPTISHLILSFTFHLKAPGTYHPTDSITSHFSLLIATRYHSHLFTLPSLSVGYPHHLHFCTSLTSHVVQLITSHLYTSITSYPYTSSHFIFDPPSQPSNICCFCTSITSHPYTFITSYTCPPITSHLCTPIASHLGTLISPCLHHLLS